MLRERQTGRIIEPAEPKTHTLEPAEKTTNTTWVQLGIQHGSSLGMGPVTSFEQVGLGMGPVTSFKQHDLGMGPVTSFKAS